MNWYVIDQPEDFGALARALKPGSSVTFYFDGRFTETDVGETALEAIAETLAETEEALVARRTAGIGLDYDYVTDLGELTEFLGRLLPSDRVIFGKTLDSYDRPGVTTVHFPDRDGAIRRHAY